MSETAKRLFGEKPTGHEQTNASGAEGFWSKGLTNLFGMLGAAYKAVEPELAKKAAHGAHEVSSALFTGNPYVQYGADSGKVGPTIESALNAGNEQENGRER